jgi:hypothetical protein
MDLGADYVTMNPNADIAIRSFRWNAFAPRWKAWRDLLAIYLKAIHSAKLGDLAPYRDWVTKQEVRSWEGIWPTLGDSTKGRDYKVADCVPDSTKLMTCTFDVQEGKSSKGEGLHIWGLVEQWEENGDSRRIAFKQLPTFTDARAFQIEHGVLDKHTACDSGDTLQRTVFARCSEWHWLALKSSDETNFAHEIVDKVTHRVRYIGLPYSTTEMESSLVGTKKAKGVRLPRGGRVPDGYAVTRTWSKPILYALLHALKSGNTDRKYGIAVDINPVFIEHIHSYMPQHVTDKKTNVATKTIWVRVKPADHGFICAAQGLVVAMIHGFYPLAQTEERRAA